MSSPKPSRFASYKSALATLSARTKTPLPSLIVSFAVLHELTAIVPLASLFFGARALGIGEQTVTYVRSQVADGELVKRSWVRETGVQWLNEGEEWAARVGRRYGVFGYANGAKSGELESPTSAGRPSIPQNLAGDVANAVFAYGVTKALLPARIGLSMYLAPACSRRLIEPLRAQIMRIWRN